jgi:hypothetical protein
MRSGVMALAVLGMEITTLLKKYSLKPLAHTDLLWESRRSVPLDKFCDGLEIRNVDPGLPRL